MTKEKKLYTILDQPRVLAHLFHPRKDLGLRPSESGRQDVMIPVDSGVEIGASLHLAGKEAPCLLFFHGNGEIVSDYDSLGQAFTRGAGVNFFVVDYRGYGVSTGTPTVAAMMSDAHKIVDFFRGVMAEQGLTGPLNIMGRSLGSAPALELGCGKADSLNSLIIESGFAFAGPLLRVLGLDPDALGFVEREGTGNLDKAGQVTCPLLVIHAEHDHLIPFSDGQALYEKCPAREKHLLKINGANHNDIFIRGMAPYIEQVRRFCSPWHVSP